jgi:SAM-dependent methyltransferase
MSDAEKKNAAALQLEGESIEKLLQRKKKIEEKILKLKRLDKIDDMDLPPAERIRRWGHRAYVGGPDPEAWYGIGKHQYHYLVAQGLRPQHRFLDIACGALRLGQYLIPFLEEGHYFGLDGEEVLVQAALEHELLPAVVSVKKPRFSFNYDFNFDFVESFDYAIAQSLFTHLTIEDIVKCFANLKPKANRDSTFYFTYFEGKSSENPTESHANRGWRYSVEELRQAAEGAGWKMTNIGDWGHQRGQKIAYVRL